MKRYRDKTWDNWYKKGVNWDNDKPSSSIIKFREYLNKKDRVLDLGCGSGRDVIYLAKNGFNSYGIDFSKIAIEKTRKRYNKKNLHLFVSKAEMLPFKDGFFDAIYSGWVLYYTDMKKSFSEINRVLKKGGIIYIVFALKTRFLKTKKVKYLFKEKEIRPFIRKFKLLKKEEYKVQNLNKRRPTKSDVLRLILKKR